MNDPPFLKAGYASDYTRQWIWILESCSFPAAALECTWMHEYFTQILPDNFSATKTDDPLSKFTQWTHHLLILILTCLFDYV